jgi:hypothetical protein
VPQLQSKKSTPFAPVDLTFPSDSCHVSEFLALEELAQMDSSVVPKTRCRRRARGGGIQPLPESELTVGIQLSLLEMSSESDSDKPGALEEGSSDPSIGSYQTDSDSNEPSVEISLVHGIHRRFGDLESDTVSEVFRWNP